MLTGSPPVPHLTLTGPVEVGATARAAASIRATPTLPHIRHMLGPTNPMCAHFFPISFVAARVLICYYKNFIFRYTNVAAGVLTPPLSPNYGTF